MLESAQQPSPEPGSTGGLKVQCCSLSLLTGERMLLITPAISTGAPCKASTCYVPQAMWCSLGSSSYAVQGKRFCLSGDAVFHQLSEWLNYAILPHVRIIPVKLPQAGCSHA